MRYLKLLLCLLLLVPILVGAEKRDNKNDFLLSKHKVGRLEVGTTVDGLYTKYDRKITKLIDLNLEGMFSPALEIYLNGSEKRHKPSLVAEILWRQGDWVIYRINVYDKRFKTDKGIGVGSTLGDIRKSYEVDWIRFGEGTLYARVAELRMSFALDFYRVSAQWYKTRDQNLIPNNAKVESVLVN